MHLYLRHFRGQALIAGLALLLPVLLYRARHLDDNSLTSWQWVFPLADPAALFGLLLLLVLLCWLLAPLPDWWRQRARFGSGFQPPWLGDPANASGSALPAGQLLIPLAAFLACLLFLDTPETIVDAGRYFLQAKSFSEYGPYYFFSQWGGEIFAWTDLPLIPALYGLLFTVFGESRLPVQLLNALFVALTALLIARLGQDLWDQETGRLGAGLLLGFPYLYSQTPLLLVDIGTMFFLVLALWSLLRAMGRGGWYIPLTGAAVVAVALSKYSAWILLSGLVPIFCCALAGPGQGQGAGGEEAGQGGEGVDSPGIGPGVGAVIGAGVRGGGRRQALIRAGLALLPALLVLLPLFWGMREVMAGQIALLLEFQGPALRQGWRESLVSTFFFQTHPLLTAALLYSLYRAWRRRDFRYAAVAWLVVLLLVIMELRRIRYTIPIFPLLALLAGYGLRDLADPVLRRQLVLVIVGSSLLLAWGAFRPFAQSMAERNLQQAGRYLDTLEEERVAVLVLAEEGAIMDPAVTVPLLDLYTRKELWRYFLPGQMAAADAGQEEFQARVSRSPLRFTWEMPTAPFYLPVAGAALPSVLVVIKSGPAASAPAEFGEKLDLLPEIQRFADDSGIFQHRPQVVIRRLAGAGKGDSRWLLTPQDGDFFLYNAGKNHLK